MPFDDYILVVDDDETLLDMLVERLSRAGYRTTHCSDAAQAVLQAKGVRPRLVITDICMPHWGTGIDAYAGIRKLPNLLEIPIIFMTALPAGEARKMMPKDPLVRLVLKPIDWGALEQAIYELLNAAPGKTEHKP